MNIQGLRLASIAAGIRYAGRDDVVLLEIPAGATTAAVFTRNAFRAAPVLLAEANLRTTAPRALIINSGNANAGTGQAGMTAAQAVCAAVAQTLQIEPQSVLPFSTGVIGEPLNVQPFVEAMPELAATLNEAGWDRAAKAIMTTDTRPKTISQTIKLTGGEINLTGIAKGAGMIRPDMATMLAFIATDAVVEQTFLAKALSTANEDSFNAITIDGDTSTNDACVVIATGASGIALNADDELLFQTALHDLCTDLALQIIRDGEGATKCVTIEVETANNRDEAREVAYTVAHSPLVKTALFACDANWGRILAAVGRAKVSDLDVGKIDIWLDEVQIVAQGERAADYSEEAGSAVFARPEFTIRIALARGSVKTHIWTTDLSHEYVRINAEYRS